MVSRGDLLAFADDMLILTNSRAEMAQAIQELDNLSGAWNLRLNKAKSQVLTEDNIPDIAGIPCVTHVKYLGVPIHLDLKEQREKCVSSIKRNLGHLKWKYARWTLTSKRHSRACWRGVSWCTQGHPWSQRASGRERT